MHCSDRTQQQKNGFRHIFRKKIPWLGEFRESITDFRNPMPQSESPNIDLTTFNRKKHCQALSGTKAQSSSEHGVEKRRKSDFLSWFDPIFLLNVIKRLSSFGPCWKFHCLKIRCCFFLLFRYFHHVVLRGCFFSTQLCLKNIRDGAGKNSELLSTQNSSF